MCVLGIIAVEVINTVIKCSLTKKIKIDFTKQ